MLKEKLRGLSLRLAKLEARLVLSERKASEGRKVTARILAHKAEGVPQSCSHTSVILSSFLKKEKVNMNLCTTGMMPNSCKSLHAL